MKKLFALLPIFVFLALFIVIGIVSNDFYTFPAVVGFGIAAIIALLQNRKVKFNQKLETFAKGAGDKNIVSMLLIFLCAGAFSAVAKASGGVDATVNLILYILPTELAVVGIFIAACFVSISMGTSVGTIVAITPLAVQISNSTGISLLLCVGAVISGAMFGDNLSMISDTTIAAVNTQGCKMKDKFKENILTVLPAAIITIIILVIATLGVKSVPKDELTIEFFKVLPYIGVLIFASIGINVFLVLISGTLLSVIVGLCYSEFSFLNVFGIIGNGMAGMYDICIISLLVAGVIALVKYNGGIDAIISGIKKLIKGKRGAEFGIAAISLLTDTCTANNTVAIVIAGPIAKEISEEFGISNKRSASLLDIFTSVGQGLIPYGAQILTAAELSKLSPVALVPFSIYPILMAVSALIFITFQIKPSFSKDKKEPLSATESDSSEIK